MITLFVKFVAIVGFVVMFVWTLVTGREATPLSGRTQVIAISERETAALGEQAFAAVLQDHAVIGSGAQAERVRQVARRIAAAADASVEARYDWRFVLLGSEQVNAFALPGGKIAVFSGLLGVARTDDQLAAVLGHEVAHVLARHGAERITQQKLAETGRAAIGVAVGDLDPAAQAAILGALGLGARFGVLMPFSRVHEAEADQIGLLIMARACYDPRAALEVWTAMARASGEGPPEWFSTHPSHGRRAEALESAMDEAQAARTEGNCPSGPAA